MKNNTNKTIGYLLIFGVLLVFIPYTLLTLYFNYPEVLRENTDKILLSFHNSGSSLVLIWLAFSLLGLLLLEAVVLIGQKFESHFYFVRWATVLGVLGFTFQIVALLRWVFVVPVLVEQYVNGNEIERLIAVSNFKIVHHFGGVLLGESLGQLFTVLWTVMLCSAFIQLKLFPKFLHIIGIISSVIYSSAQMEYLHVVMPGIPYFSFSGYVGSILWLLYLLILGFYFVKSETE